MLVQAIDKLIDRIIQLFQYQEKVRKETLENYIDPIYVLFEQIHNEYLKDFRKYREMIINSKSPLNASHPLFDLIKTDSLYSQDQRGKLEALIDPLMRLRESKSENEKLIGILLWEITGYIRVTNSNFRIIVSEWEPDIDLNSLNKMDGNVFDNISELMFQAGSYDMSSNIRRFELTYGLKLIFKTNLKEEKKQNEGIKLIDELVRHMQKKYLRITAAYVETRTNLMTEKSS